MMHDLIEIFTLTFIMATSVIIAVCSIISLKKLTGISNVANYIADLMEERMGIRGEQSD